MLIEDLENIKLPKNFGIIMMHVQKYASQAISFFKQTGELLYRGVNRRVRSKY